MKTTTATKINERLLFQQLPLIFLLLFVSCSTEKKPEENKELFTIETHIVSLPEMLDDIFYFNEDIVCKSENGRIFVLDSYYRHKKDIEDRLASEGIDNIFQYRDTVWVSKKVDGLVNRRWYYFNSEYQLVYADSPDFYRSLIKAQGDFLFEDSAYIVYGGCAGEFGGTVFFYSKSQKKTYSFPATCPSQVLVHNNAYYVVADLAHLAGSTVQLKFSNPDLLYYTPDNTEYFIPNFWSGVDSITSLEYYPNEDVLRRRMVKIYGRDVGTLTIVSFIHNNEAYSIRHHDSGYSISIWQDSIRTVQSFNTPVPLGYDIRPKSYGDVSISLCKRHYSTLGGMQEDHNSSNILVRKGNKIDILACYNRKDIFSRPE